MKALIQRIITDNNLKIEDYTYQDLDTIFAHFEDKNDFFIFIFSSYTHLLSIMNIETSKEIEYALNSYTVGYKKKFLDDYKQRDLDYNLSLILVLEEDVEIPKLDFIEENPFNSKKYILQYNRADLESLEQNIDYNLTNISHTLNALVVKNSSFLKEEINKDNSWYDLLLRLFIKIPFLNYQKLEKDKVEELRSLDEVILAGLDESQKQILELLETNIGIEDFISEITKIISENE